MFSVSDRLLRRPRHSAYEEIEEYVRERPKRSIAGLLFIGALVAIGIWAWPELRRTVHIHRM
ncbi:MAG TPA: hypothetical protein VL282_18460 [Tepidisphaeraceae bacterium]|jgi:hypothetical protein|nr:hypothetical protein [Tepidisphaeraceae bacterium]